MSDETTVDEIETDESPGIVETVLSAVGLGNDEPEAEAVEAVEEVAVESDHDAAKRRYQSSAGLSARRKQDRKAAGGK